MGRGFGETKRLVLEAFAAYPHHLISTEVLLWWYTTTIATITGCRSTHSTRCQWGRTCPGRQEAINVRRSLRGLHKKRLIKCWGRLRHMCLQDGSKYDNHRLENFWSALSCEGAKGLNRILAYIPRPAS
jgi:hypothetical protein